VVAALGVEPTIAAPPPLVNVLLNIVPRNPFAALASTNTLQVIFVAIAVGLAILAVGSAAEHIRKGFVSLNEIIMKITAGVMLVAPIGVFALIAHSFANLGLSAILALIGFVGTVWFALAFHTIFIYGGALKLFVGKDPHTGKSLRVSTLFRKAAPALAFAFSSASSAATLPLTMRCSRNMGFNREMSSVAFPLGVTLNMDGTAIFQGCAVIFLSTLYGVELGIGGVVTVLLTATLATLGTAGVPGAGMIMLSVVLASLGMPIEAIALIFGIDRIVDMPRTAINVCGDFIYAMIVGKPENMVNFEQFNAKTDLAQMQAMEEAESVARGDVNTSESNEDR
jgi:Na+/H+-dicarboxylate symporter